MSNKAILNLVKNLNLKSQAMCPENELFQEKRYSKYSLLKIQTLNQ